MDENPKYLRYLQLFRGREELFAQQGEDQYWPVNAPFSELYLQQHLTGDVTFGLYLLDTDNNCHLLCFDLDIPKSELSSIDIHNPAAKFEYLFPRLSAVLEVLESQIGLPPESILLEETGGRGYHAWLFLERPLDGSMAVSFGKLVKGQIEFELEFFPKQASLTPDRKFGNLIKLPLGIHRTYLSRSKFFTIGSLGPEYLDNDDANLEHLKSIQVLDPGIITTMLSETTEDSFLTSYSDYLQQEVASRPTYKGTVTFLISNCTAMKLIQDKAEAGESLTHTEIFNYANTLLSIPRGSSEIHSTIQRSLGPMYSREKTDDEIEKIKNLRQTSCRTLIHQNLCPDYCKESVRNRNENELLLNTSPCSVWLERESRKVSVSPEMIRVAITDPEKIKLAYLRLKKYHENEDTLFFDPFDFDQYERMLHENCVANAKAFESQCSLLLSGYLPVLIPKNINSEFDLEYRKMSYSTVFDQVQIQSVFDALGPYIDDQFLDCSFGYRWNKDSSTPYRIFEDWRKAYPRFRSMILSSLNRYPNGFHVCFDIKGFYDNVNQEILLQQLREQINDDFILQLVSQTVESYEFEDGSSKGLPQGPAFARLLANLYLNDFDTFASEVAERYFRYVDDFVMVFKSADDAERGLRIIVGKLKEFGLLISQAVDKKPDILPNSDISRVRKTLEKIRYGILESTRHIRYLDPDTVDDFYNAVERVSGRPINTEQLIEINQALPTWLYVASQEALIPHPFRTKLLRICEYLITQQLFCPKGLKSVFYRLIELETDNQKLVSLFDELLPSHKAYFLLSAYGYWNSHNEKKELLSNILQIAITNSDPFVFGFAIAMLTNRELNQGDDEPLEYILGKLSSQENWFGLVRFLGSHDYLSLASDDRNRIRQIVSKSSLLIIRLHLLGNVSEFPQEYLDSIYLRELIQEFHPYLLPVATSLFVNATDFSEFFKALVQLFIDHPTYKNLTVDLLTGNVSEKQASAGLADIENLNALYQQISDPELKNSLLNALENIKKYSAGYDEEFAKTHNPLDHYYGCYLFENVADQDKYTHLELIPERVIANQYGSDISLAKRSVDDLSEKRILPELDFYYDSSEREISVQYRLRKEYTTASKGTYDLNSEDSINEVLRVASDAFKKAIYFRRTVGKTPEVSISNLLIDRGNGEVLFRTIGRSLGSIQVLAGYTIGNTESDISLMVALLIEDLFFNTREDLKTFLDAKYHTPIKAFVAQLIRNMTGKDASLRYSTHRFDFLIEHLSDATKQAHGHVAVLYLRERLRSALFRHNISGISWAGVSRAFNAHVTHIRSIFSGDEIAGIRYRNHIFAINSGKRNLHALSKQFHNLRINLDEFSKPLALDESYWNLVEYLLLQSILNIELISLCRAIPSNLPVDKEPFENIDIDSELIITAADYETQIHAPDFMAILMYREDGSGVDLRDLSLSQIAILILISIGTCDFNKKITINRSSNSHSPPYASPHSAISD